MNLSTRTVSRVIVASLAILLSERGLIAGELPPRGSRPLATTVASSPRLALWLADAEGMHPSRDLEGFLVDRLGASGERLVVEPETVHALLRTLGLAQRRIFDPLAARQLAAAADAGWILWVKIVSRDLTSARGLSIPYLLNRRRLDAHAFFDVRVYDAAAGRIVGSKRLRLSDKGEGTWQVVDDERFDPVYNNDPVEIHQRQRMLDWRASAAISGYCADLLRPPRTVKAANQKSTTDVSPEAPATVAPGAAGGSGGR